MYQPNILLIYTGGTIGMIKDPETGVLKAFDFDNLLEKIPELKLLDCTIETISFDKAIDSSDMDPNYWVKIAEIIALDVSEDAHFMSLRGRYRGQ